VGAVPASHHDPLPPHNSYRTQREGRGRGQVVISAHVSWKGGRGWWGQYPPATMIPSLHTKDTVLREGRRRGQVVISAHVSWEGGGGDSTRQPP
jgi:hypothetical protein